MRERCYRLTVDDCKWHLGLGAEGKDGKEGGPDWNGELKPGPLEIGFDTCFLLPTTNDRVPQVYVKGEFIGGCDIVKDMFDTGELAELLQSRGIDVKPAG